MVRLYRDSLSIAQEMSCGSCSRRIPGLPTSRPLREGAMECLSQQQGEWMIVQLIARSAQTVAGSSKGFYERTS